MPAAPQVATDGGSALGRGPGGTVPQVGVVEQDVAPLLVEGDLPGHPLEPGRDPVGAARGGCPGSTRRKPLAGDVGSKWTVKATPGQMSRWGPDWWSVCHPMRE